MTVKPLWNTTKFIVSKDMINISKSGKVTIKNTSTKKHNISKSNDLPSIDIKAKDVDKPSIVMDGKNHTIDEIKQNLGKVKKNLMRAKRNLIMNL
jgi:hypothetical protein